MLTKINIEMEKESEEKILAMAHCWHSYVELHVEHENEKQASQPLSPHRRFPMSRQEGES